MTDIVVEHSPNPTRLAQFGVFAWPIWEKEVSEFPWHYDEKEVVTFLKATLR